MTLRAGIIGAGKIAWRYDGGAWVKNKPAVTLASCLDRHPDTLLVAIHDPVVEARHHFDANYLGPRPVEVYKKLDEFLDQKFDLVAIASPSKFHTSHIRACMDASIPKLWIEKPVTLRLDEFDQLRKYHRSMPKPPKICVNFLRRGLPQLMYMKNHLEQGSESAESVSISVAYSRRLDVNGVHLLDLLGALTDATEVPSLDFLRMMDGVNPHFGLTLKGHPVTVTGHDLPYHLIEISITDQRGRLSLVRGAQELIWEAVEPTPDYPGFYRLARPVRLESFAGAESAFHEATYQMLCSLVNEGEPSPSTLESAWFSQALMDRVQLACSECT